MNRKKVGVVVNKVRGEKYELTLKEIESTCGTKVIATIPDDNRVPESISEGVPVVIMAPYSRSNEAFKKLAGSLIGKDYRTISPLLQDSWHLFTNQIASCNESTEHCRTET